MCRLSANNCALAQLAVEQKGSMFPVPGGGSSKRLGEPAQRDMSSILHSLKSLQGRATRTPPNNFVNKLF